MSDLSIFTNPGQNVSLVTQVLDNSGQRVDGYQPVVDFVVFPDLSNAEGYPLPMQQIGLGLYLHNLIIPSGPGSLGTFIASVSWPHPDSGITQYQLFSIQVAMPFGVSTVSPG